MAYDFSLDRKSVVILSAGSAVILLLVFAGGVMTGITWRAEEDFIAANRSKPAAPKIREAATPVPGRPEKQETAAAAPPPEPAASAPAPPPAATSVTASAAPAAAATAPPVTAPGAAASAAPAPSASETPVHSATVSGVQLAVQVGAFLDKGNAQKLVDRLKEEGYEPQIILAGHAPRSWNIVRVGPYQDWDQASEIAAVLSRDQPTPAVVRPMR
jgi:cell division septation protein DedD